MHTKTQTHARARASARAYILIFYASKLLQNLLDFSGFLEKN